METNLDVPIGNRKNRDYCIRYLGTRLQEIHNLEAKFVILKVYQRIDRKIEIENFMQQLYKR